MFKPGKGEDWGNSGSKDKISKVETLRVGRSKQQDVRAGETSVAINNKGKDAMVSVQRYKVSYFGDMMYNM